jgi:hypothetical protein
MILAILAGLVVFASFAVIGALMSLASALERCRQADQRWTIVVVERRPRVTPPLLPPQSHRQQYW